MSVFVYIRLALNDINVVYNIFTSSVFKRWRR